MKNRVRNFLAEAWSFSKKHWIISLILGIIISLFIIDNFFPFKDDSGLTMPDTTAYVNKNVANADAQINQSATQATNQAPTSVQTSNAKTYDLCLRLNRSNNMHLPALMGSQMQFAVDNGHTGYNWRLQTNASGKEDFGIMPNGTFFAKEAFLIKWGLSSGVEIKWDKTEWQPVELQKGTINGQPAYIYK